MNLMEKLSFLVITGALALVLPGCGFSPPPTVTVVPFTAPTLSAEPTGAGEAFLLEGEYLGQRKPGLMPEPFAAEVFSVDGRFGLHLHSSLFFFPDGQEVYFTNQAMETFELIPMFMNQEDGVWSEPRVASLQGVPSHVSSLVFSRDWSRLYLYSSPPEESREVDDVDPGFWMMERAEHGWSEAQQVGPPAGIERNEGALYFSALLEGGQGSYDVYRSRFVEGRYTEPENMGEVINTAGEEYVACVAPDERFLIFYRFVEGRKTASGLYVTFQEADDAWSEPVRLDYVLGLDSCFDASLSPDGRYLFLLDRGDGVYWVEARVLDSLRE
jgi:hypothetical protein